MIFGPEMVAKVLAGEKTVTRRRSVHRNGRPLRYQPGRIYAVQSGRGQQHVGHIRISSVELQRLSTVMQPGEARREGFRSRPDFIDYWKRLHGSIDYAEKVSRIAFILAPRCQRCLGL